MSHPSSSRLSVLLHHLGVALAFASLLFVLEHAGLLAWLDSLSLRVVSSLHGEDAAEAFQDPPAPTDPVVIAISPAMYEVAFGQRSPLDRAIVASMIPALVGSRPGVLAIDIDLSPAGGGEVAAQRALDDALARAVSEGTPVVLATPLPVVSDVLLETKYQWMRRMCEAGVAFGHPYVPLTQGVTLRLLSFPGSIVEQARAALASDKAILHHETAPCSVVRQGLEKAIFLSRDYPLEMAGVHGGAHQHPIRVELLARVTAGLRSLTSAQELAATPALTGRAVFFGGGYDDQDRFTTVLGTSTGLVIHAAGFAASFEPTTNVSHVWAFLIDLIIGTLAGYAFHFTWSRYNVAASALAWRKGELWPPYLRARGWMMANVIALLVFLVLVFSWSSWLLRLNLWNNPGPMLIGVFLKLAVASRTPLVEHPHEEVEHAASRWTPTASRIDRLVWAPIVLLAFYYLLVPGH